MILPLVALATIGVTVRPVGQADGPPAMPREFRAAWVATVDNIDWPSKRGLPSDRTKAELLRIVEVAASLRLNALIFQIRPSADALYASKIEPWSEYLTGLQGQPPKPAYDPLAFLIAAAHKRGIEVHVWFNPYRARHPAQRGPMAANHIAVKNPALVKSYGKYLWMDPGEPAVQKRSRDVILDVVRRYDVDGVHIDDYFYPYTEKTPDGRIIPFPDEPSYRRYRNGGGTLAKEDWRRKNVDDFVRTTYEAIKAEKRWVKFGISPFGIYRPGVPAGIKAGVDQYAELYADARKWLREGWCDYFTPQLYWPIAQTAQAFPVLLDYWLGENVKSRHLWPGLFTGRTIPGEGTWQPKEVVDQIALIRERGAGGAAHFSMRAFLQNARGVRTALTFGPYRAPAAVPESPWLGSDAPAAPVVANTTFAADTLRLSVSAPEEVRFIGWAKRIGSQPGVWSEWALTSSRELTIPLLPGDAAVAVASVSRTGVWSPAVAVTIPAP